MEVILDGNYFPVEMKGFVVCKGISGIYLADSWLDKVFVAGPLFWNDGTNSAGHVCVRCTPLSRIVTGDHAVTTWLEMLHQREAADSFGGIALNMQDVYVMGNALGIQYDHDKSSKWYIWV